MLAQSHRTRREFWWQNVKSTYEFSNRHGSAIPLLLASLFAIAGVGGISVLTDNRVIKVLGAPAGVLAFFVLLMLFVTPANMWVTDGRSEDGHGRLSGAQRAAMREVLRKYPRDETDQEYQYRYFIIFPIPGDAGASLLAADIREIFGACGLDPQLKSDGELPGLRDFSRYKHGVWLRGDGSGDMGAYNPLTLDIIREVLESASIDYTYAADGVSDVELIIGSPLPSPSDEAVLAHSNAAVLREQARLRQVVADRNEELDDLKAYRTTQEERFEEARPMLNEFQRKHQRHLTEEQKSTIRAFTVTKTTEAVQAWPPDFDRHTRFCITLCSIGTESETYDYRRDFENALSDAFAIRLEDWSVAPYLDDFRNAVSVIDPVRPTNIVHPWIMESLRAAKVQNVRLQPTNFQPPGMVHHFNPVLESPWRAGDPSVWIVIGQNA